MITFKLSIKFNKETVRKVEVEAKDEKDLIEVLKRDRPFWFKNKDRMTKDVK